MNVSGIGNKLQLQEKLKSNRKIYLLLIVLVVIIVGLVGVVLWLVQQNNQLRKQLAVSPTPRPEDDQPLAETPDPTANWKVYSNPQTPFTFKYPSSKPWEDQYAVYVSIKGAKQPADKEDLYDGIYLEFNKKPIDLGSKTLSEYIDTAIEEIPKEFATLYEEKRTINTGNASGYSYMTLGPDLYKHYFLQSPKGKNVYYIHEGVLDYENQEYRNLVNQILSTFEFIE